MAFSTVPVAGMASQLQSSYLLCYMHFFMDTLYSKHAKGMAINLDRMPTFTPSKLSQALQTHAP